MLTLQECLDFCELSEEQICAIAEHEHVPEIIAAELGECLLHSEEGVCLIRRFMQDDIERAQAAGHLWKAQYWQVVLERLDAQHAQPKVA